MQAIPNLDFGVVEPQKPSLSRFVGMLIKAYRNLVAVVNGKIGFGDGTLHDNVDGTWANVVAPAAVNTDFTITHNLGRVPVGYWVMQKDRACDVYTGSVAATTTQLTLRASVASAVLRLFIIGLLLGLLSNASRAQIQGAAHVNVAFKTTIASGTGVSGSILQPIPSATITVCNGQFLPLSGMVCIGLASIFSNITLTTVLGNPFNADLLGNYSFYAAAGSTYIVSVSATGLTTYSYVWTAPLAGGPRFQQFTSSGTFTIPAGVTTAKVTVIGAGGAGGGSNGANAGTGGGSGGTSFKWLSGLTPGNTISVTVGIGGTGVSAANGNSGTASAINSGTQIIVTVNAGGGGGGNANVTSVSSGGTAGVVGSGADLTFTGSSGFGASSGTMGTSGAPSFLGGVSGISNNTVGAAATVPGSGGGGAQGTGPFAGGNGANGLVIFEWVQ